MFQSGGTDDGTGGGWITGSATSFIFTSASRQIWSPECKGSNSVAFLWGKRGLDLKLIANLYLVTGVMNAQISRSLDLTQVLLFTTHCLITNLFVRTVSRYFSFIARRRPDGLKKQSLPPVSGALYCSERNTPVKIPHWSLRSKYFRLLHSLYCLTFNMIARRLFETLMSTFFNNQNGVASWKN